MMSSLVGLHEPCIGLTQLFDDNSHRKPLGSCTLFIPRSPVHALELCHSRRLGAKPKHFVFDASSFHLAAWLKPRRTFQLQLRSTIPDKLPPITGAREGLQAKDDRFP